MNGYKGWRNTRVSWKSVTYMHEGFRRIVIQYESEQNLSRFIWRTAKLNGMREITLSDVTKMLQAADETIFILRGDEMGRREFTPAGRKPTWVMTATRKDMWVALNIIEKMGWAESRLEDIQIGEKECKQRVWTLA